MIALSPFSLSLSFSLSLVIVARIRFSEPQYTVREGPQICLDIINELYDPASPPTDRIIITVNIGKYSRGLCSVTVVVRKYYAGLGQKVRNKYATSTPLQAANCTVAA